MEIVYSIIFIGMISSKIAWKIVGIGLQCRRDTAAARRWPRPLRSDAAASVAAAAEEEVSPGPRWPLWLLRPRWSCVRRYSRAWAATCSASSASVPATCATTLR